MWTMIVNISCLIFVSFSRKKTSTSRSVKHIIAYVIVLALYTSLVCMANGEMNSYTLGKPLRLLFVLLMFNIISTRISGYKTVEIVWGLSLALMIHLVCVYLQFLFPETKLLFYSILDSDKDVVDLRLRAFGLCTSFDGAGLYICVLQTLLWVIFKTSHSRWIFSLCFASFIGCFLVSRLSMAVSSVYMAMMLLTIFKNDKKFSFLFVLPVVFVGCYYAYGYAQSIMLDANIEESYRHESVEYLTGEMLELPSSFLDTLIGTGNRAPSSDIGYVNIIYMIGLIGLGLVLSMYLYTIKSIKFCKIYHRDVYLFMLLFIVLLFIFNYKLLLLYARGINDVYLLLIFIIGQKQNYLKYEK